MQRLTIGADMFKRLDVVHGMIAPGRATQNLNGTFTISIDDENMAEILAVDDDPVYALHTMLGMKVN
jgi:hypothetical protein